MDLSRVLSILADRTLVRALAITGGLGLCGDLLAATSQLNVTLPLDGKISSSPGAIECGRRSQACTDTFETGTVVTLTASSTTHAFGSWGGDCAGDNPVCELTMAEDRFVSANFVPVSLDVVVSGYGRVTSSLSGISCPEDCESDYPIGSSIILTATPDANEQFLGWGGACQGTGSCVVELNESLSVSATFTQNTQFFDLVVIPPEHGYVVGTPGRILCGEGTLNNCQSSLAEGSQVVFSPYAAQGYEFGSWGGDCSGETCLVTMDDNKEISAVFNLIVRDYVLTVTLAGNGSVSSGKGIINCPDAACSAEYPAGALVSLTATPKPGETFLGWSGGGCSGTGGCEVSITDRDIQVSAGFSTDIDYFTLSTTVVGAGSITSSPGNIVCGENRREGCSESFTDGTEVTLTASVQKGYRFSGWSGACTGTGSCVVTMDAPKSVTATFEALNQEYLLTVGRSGHGSVSSSNGDIECPGGACSKSYPYGTKVSLTAQPLNGEQFLGWNGGCQGLLDCLLEITADTSVTAVFTQDNTLFSLTPQSSNGGSIQRDPGGLYCGRRAVQYCYTQGTPLTLTAVADNGFVFSGWLGDCTGPNPCVLTVVSNLAVTAAFSIDPDTDGDGIPDSRDTDDDGDGYSDIEEAEFGTDPLDPDDTPVLPGLNPAIISVISRERKN